MAKHRHKADAGSKQEHSARTSTRTDRTVKSGGIAPSDADVEDISRDTYGFPTATEPARSREERLSEADRAAAKAGIPGVTVAEAAATETVARKEQAQRARGRSASARRRR
jgi:hypothetical protein